MSLEVVEQWECQQFSMKLLSLVASRVVRSLLVCRLQLQRSSCARCETNSLVLIHVISMTGKY